MLQQFFISSMLLFTPPTKHRAQQWHDWWPGRFAGSSQYMTCVGVDGSEGSPEFWASGQGDGPGQQAYDDTLTWVNVADRNPAYIEVKCGW